MAKESVVFGPAIAALLRPPRLMELGRGQPDSAMRRPLASLSTDTAFLPATVEHEDMAKACLAGLWLYHDFLEESHQISQGIDTPTGAFWHGILHRREGDFSNAKYWFRRVGAHPVLKQLAIDVSEMDGAGNLPTMAVGWDPVMFVDLCQRAQGPEPDLEPLCREIQMAEWNHLFAFSYQNAVADSN
jgi:hypothetical protein